MHTEDEARTKWCPLVRVGERASGAAENRPDGSYNCIASECMAWRWAQKLNPNHPIGMNTTEPAFIDDTTHGFCGLAGKS